MVRGAENPSTILHRQPEMLLWSQLRMNASPLLSIIVRISGEQQLATEVDDKARRRPEAWKTSRRVARVRVVTRRGFLAQCLNEMSAFRVRGFVYFYQDVV